MSPAIRVENLCKRYRLGERRREYATLRESLTGAVAAPFRRLARGRAAAGEPALNGRPAGDSFWALSDVSFEVQPGEVVGIIGRNGAGKSTLLKILSRVTEPTRGRVELRGRVGSLLEVGTGFHHELTGRENVYMNGSILGMSRREIDRKFDEIVAFADIDEFLDTPVKRYSSGMYVRLAFAIAAHLEPEILIVDEVLAVGDLEFQKKCLGKMDDVAKGGRTVFLVSHHLPTIRALTTHTLYMESGRLKRCAATPEAIQAYLDDSAAARSNGELGLAYYRQGAASGSPARIDGVGVVDAAGEPAAGLPALESGEPIVLYVDIVAARDVRRAAASIVLVRDSETCVGAFVSSDSGEPLELRAGRQRIRCRIAGLPLSPGRYAAMVRLGEVAGRRQWDTIVDLPVFSITLASHSSGELTWPNRPWGAVHWQKVTWKPL